MHNFTSAVTSYGAGSFAFLAGQDLGTWAAVLGLAVLAVRLIGDVPKAITAWQNLLEKHNGSSND